MPGIHKSTTAVRLPGTCIQGDFIDSSNNDAEIFYYNGTTVTQLTDDP